MATCTAAARGSTGGAGSSSAAFPDERARVHGNDERVSVENLRFGTRFLCGVPLEVGEERGASGR